MFNRDNVLRSDPPDRVVQPHVLEAGSGPPVILVHASMAGAREWSSLMPHLQTRHLVRAVNLFGYGGTPPWPKAARATLDDFAALVLRAVPDNARRVCLVGHSFGGAVAMRAAEMLGARVQGLVLIEPSIFPLLRDCGRAEAWAEITALSDTTLRLIGNGVPEAAAERFLDYWSGPATWASMPEARQEAVLTSIVHLPREWAAVLEDGATLPQLKRSLPAETLLMSFANTTRPSRELVDILSHAFPQWLIATVAEAGHMGPLTHPHLVNPVIRDYLRAVTTAPRRRYGNSL